VAKESLLKQKFLRKLELMELLYPYLFGPFECEQQELRIETPPSIGLISGVSEILLHLRFTGEAISSVVESEPEFTGNRIIECSSIVLLAGRVKCPK